LTKSVHGTILYKTGFSFFRVFKYYQEIGKKKNNRGVPSPFTKGVNSIKTKKGVFGLPNNKNSGKTDMIRSDII
jgi:hypothetical protein